MNVLKGFLYVCAGAFALGGLALGALLGKLTWFIGLPVIAVGLGLGWAVWKAARRFNVQQSESQKLQFEATVRQLAERNGGTVGVQAIQHATGVPKEEIQERMRALMGRGVVEMDFGANGEMLFRLTPMDEARADLARLHERERV